MPGSRIRLGVVSFLNARPLIAGLEGDPRVSLRFDVPAALPKYLERGAVDVALVPIIDHFRSGGRLALVSDACIACDGPTLTVRVFSPVPPERVRTLYADPDSHTSVALARVLWQDLYGVTLHVRALDHKMAPPPQAPAAVLLIGDKVVRPRARPAVYELDLGAAWKSLTGLPFVFAVWVARRSGTSLQAPPPSTPDPAAEDTLPIDVLHPLYAVLNTARNAGVARLAQLAEEHAAAHGWAANLARHYLVDCLRYSLDARAQQGAQLFLRRSRALQLLDAVDLPTPAPRQKSVEAVR